MRAIERTWFFLISTKSWILEAPELSQLASSKFWRKTFEVALGELASRVAPRAVVLYEGDPNGTRNRDYDANCYQAIFGNQKPDTVFISAGNSMDVASDRLGTGRTVAALTSGTKLVRVIDRDDKNDAEVRECKQSGVRVLSLRHLECYLWDDETLAEFCNSHDTGCGFQRY